MQIIHTSTHLVELYLNQNGLKDAVTAQILACLSTKLTLKRFTYSNNEIGQMTAVQVGRMLLWPNPSH